MVNKTQKHLSIYKCVYVYICQCIYTYIHLSAHKCVSGYICVYQYILNLGSLLSLLVFIANQNQQQEGIFNLYSIEKLIVN